MPTPQNPRQRNNVTDALYKNEAMAGDKQGLFHRSIYGFSSSAGRSFANPLVNADASPKLKAKNDSAGLYYAFVPTNVVSQCVEASNNQGPKPALKITLFFHPFTVNSGIFDCGLRSIVAARTDDSRVLISVPGNEADGNWGIGITNTQIQELLQQANAGYSTFKVTVVAAWSAGWKGMVATMRSNGRVNDLVSLDSLEQVIFYDCLYFTNQSKGLVDDALNTLQKVITKQSNRILQVVAYLATPGGNDSLDQQAILAGIPFLKTNNLGQGLITLTDSTRPVLRKVCIIRAIAWALEDGALSEAQVPPVIRSACMVIDGTKRNTVRSVPALPYGKGAPPGTVDLARFASDSSNAPLLNLNISSTEFSNAAELVNAGRMIFSGTFSPGEVDHMVIMPELAWEFLAG